MDKKYFLFFQYGNVGGSKFFCGAIDSAFLDEKVDVSVYGFDDELTYLSCVEHKLCIAFTSLKEAKMRRFDEEKSMRICDDYAENAMYEEDNYLF